MSGLPFAFAVSSLVVAACSGGTTSSAAKVSASGTAGGRAVPSTDVTAFVGTSDAGVGPSSAYIEITNLEGICDIALRNGNPANAASLGITVGATALKAGSYLVGGPPSGSPYAYVEYSRTDATCNISFYEKAESGSVTLKHISASLVQGTFDVTMKGGDHVNGSFSAPVCGVTLTGAAPVGACGS